MQKKQLFCDQNAEWLFHAERGFMMKLEFFQRSTVETLENLGSEKSIAEPNFK